MKKYFKKASVAAIACAVAVSSLPGMTIFAEESQTDTSILNSSWSEDIDSMLEGRDYTEGQVIAVFDNSVSESDAFSTLSDDEETEDLGVLSDESVEEVVDADLENSDEAAAIRIISSDEKSTEDLLNELASNPSVIYAQPNYINKIEAASETETTETESAAAVDETDASETETTETELTVAADETAASETEVTNLEDEADATITENSETETVAPLADSTVKKIDAEGKAQDLIDNQGYESIGDLSYLQWGYNNDADSLYSIHSPYWNTLDGTNINEEDNVVVGILDTGIDYTNPDLKDQIVDLSKYVSYAGKYGYNSSGEKDKATDPMDEEGHGTHCAGIMVSKWDGIGTSGVASGAKIAAVRITASNGDMTDEAITRGFMCFKEAVENGLNLKAINCSIGASCITDVELMMINELGKLGVISCYASGNESEDIDEMAGTAAEIATSPYAISVNAENGMGQLVDFSCYGQTSTDLLSPGCAILSTVAGEEASYMASVDDDSLSYDGFTGTDSESGVKIYSLGIYDMSETEKITYSSEKEFINIIKKAQENEEAGKVVKDENSFDGDGYSYEIDVPGLNNNEAACYLVAMPIDEEDVQDLTGFSLAMKSPFKQTDTWTNAFEVSTAKKSTFKGSASIDYSDNWIASNGTWSNESLNLLHNDSDKLAYPYYNGCLYFIAEVGDNEGTGVGGKLYIDSVGAGYNTLRYTFMDGTSMATPAITGSTAIVYSQLEESGKLNGLTAAEKAAYVADTVKAKTVQRDYLKSTCTSEGAFDFNVTEEENYTPVIDSVKVSDDRVVTIKGNFLGEEKGTLSINGKACEITSWNNENITATIPSSLKNGRFSLNLTASNGKTTTRKIIVDITQTSGNQAFEGKVELPEAIKGCQLKLTALNGTLYAFPETLTGNASNTVIWNTMWAYDKDDNTWEQCANIPLSKNINKVQDNYCSISVSTYGNYVVAQVEYIIKQTSKTETYTDEYFLYNPKKDTWTKLDLSGLSKTPENATICGCDAGLFLVGGYSGDDENYNIYKIKFDVKQVKNGAASVKATKLTKAGYFYAADMGDATYSSYGDEILVCDGTYCSWLKWSDYDGSFDLVEQKVKEKIGGSGQSVSFNAEYATCLTPSGAIVTAMNGNDYTNRGYDTFYLNEDGTRTNFGKFASFADLYNSSACYSDGTMYVWGDSAYTEEETLGVLTYTSVNMPRVESVTVSGSSVTVSWRPLDYSGYVRLYYKIGNGKWYKWEDYSSKKTSCTLYGLYNGTKYSFTVRAVDKNGKSISGYDKTGTSIVYLTKPTINKAVSTKAGCATVKWSKNSKATGYQIYYKYGSTSKKITVNSKKTIQKVIKNLKKGKTYSFKVRSYKTVSGTTYYSQWSAVKKVTIKK